MRRLLSGWIVAGLAMMASPALAAPAVYKVTPQAAPSDGRLILHDMAWQCAGGSCVAPRNGRSTDTTVCSSLARGLGRLTAFAVDEVAFDPAALEKCNRRARS